jgi:lysophospholipase L1-like esterase
MISEQDIIVFQGDSITDAERDKEQIEPNRRIALGSGYVNLIASNLLYKHPHKNLQIYNRGVSGDRIVDLYARWKLDCLNLNPNIISILIGVNDTWHEFGRQNGVEVDRYENMYREMLDFTKQRLPDVRLVLCEPFVLLCGAVTEAWLPEINQRQQIVKRLAAEFDAVFVPFQNALDTAVNTAPPSYWLGDGVHPTAAGHYLLAQVWLESVGI